MYKYILKRMVMLIPVIIGVTLIVFGIMDMSPGDPAQIILGADASKESLNQLREELGLNRPLLVRYFSYMGGLLRGDLGTSYKNGLSVAAQIAEKLPNTMLLASAAMFIAVMIGIPFGIISAKKQYSFLDNSCMIIALIGLSAPAFWQGLISVIVFALNLGWFPAAGKGEGILGTVRSLILPAFTVGAGTAAVVTRQTRSSMLDVIHQDYIDTARAKGVKESVVTSRHMLKNALIPIITVVGLQYGVLLGGSVATETVFAWPGLGRFIIDSIKTKDIPSVMGSVIILAILSTIVNLMVDILYAFVDPRIKSQYRSK